MTFTIVFLAIISGSIFLKLRDISLRNDLTVNSEKRLLISGILVVLFLVTSATFPYPQSIYWFLCLSVLLIGSLLCLDILKKEVVRFKNLKTKEMIMNILFYSLFIVITQIYI